MRIEIHVYHHADDDTRRDLFNLQTGLEIMNANLSAAIAAITADDAALKGQLDQLLAQDSDTKAAIAKAVADALAQANVDDETAATAIGQVDAALKAHSDAITAVLQPAGSSESGDPGPGNGALAIADQLLGAGVVGQSYTDSIVVSGGEGPYGFTSTPDSQNGILVGANGAVSGTPKNAETDIFNVVVTDATGATASATVQVPIAAASSGG